MRKNLAKDEGIAPFMVFSDATLTQIAIKFPGNRMEFLEISGVGKQKLEKYGEIFLKEVRIYKNYNNTE